MNDLLDQDHRRAYLMRRLFAMLRDAGVSKRDDRLRLYRFVTCHPVGSTDDLTDIELESLIQALRGWQSSGRLVEAIRSATEAE